MNTQYLAGNIMPDNATIGNPALGDSLQGILENEGGVGYFGRLIPSLIGLILVGGSIALMLYLLWGGVEYITSGGDKQSLQNAQAKIRNAIVGVIVMFSMFAVVQLIETFLGINIMTIDIGPFIIQ